MSEFQISRLPKRKKKKKKNFEKAQAINLLKCWSANGNLHVHEEGKMWGRAGASLHSGLVPPQGFFQGRAQSRSCGGEPAVKGRAADSKWGGGLARVPGGCAEWVAVTFAVKTLCFGNRVRVQRENLKGQMCVCSSGVCLLPGKLWPSGWDTKWGGQNTVLPETPSQCAITGEPWHF